MLVKTEKGMKDVKIIDVTPENYIVPQGEEHLYHAVIEVKKFDPESGKRISRPEIKKVGIKTFDAGKVRQNWIKQGFTITILHDPNDWIQEQSQIEADARAKAAEEKAANAQKRQDEANEARQAEISEAVKAALTEYQKGEGERIKAAVQEQISTMKAKKPETSEPTKAEK